MTRNTDHSQKRDRMDEAKSTIVPGNTNSSLDRRRVLQGLAGGAAMAVIGSGSSTAKLGQPRSDPLSEKRVYVDPALQLKGAFSQTVSTPNPSEVDLALLATNTELEPDVVYDFLNTETPVSILGDNADLYAIDYLTEGRGQIDGVRVANNFAEEFSASTFDPQSTGEVDQNFGFEIIPRKTSESTTLVPDEKSINLYVNFGDDGSLKSNSPRTKSLETENIINNIRRNLIRDRDNFVSSDETESGEKDSSKCDDGDLRCGGLFFVDGESSGGTWQKKVIGGYIDLNDDESVWAVRSRINMDPDQTYVRDYENKYFRRETHFKCGTPGEDLFVQESEPPTAGSVKSYSYSIGIGSDLTGSSEWTETTHEKAMDIEHHEYTDKVYHKFHDFSDSLNDATAYGEPMCRVRTPDGALDYTYEDKIKWQREWGQGDAVNLDGYGRWMQS